MVQVLQGYENNSYFRLLMCILKLTEIITKRVPLPRFRRMSFPLPSGWQERLEPGLPSHFQFEA